MVGKGESDRKVERLERKVRQRAKGKQETRRLLRTTSVKKDHVTADQ